jgi:GxxExxY protein
MIELNRILFFSVFSVSSVVQRRERMEARDPLTGAVIAEAQLITYLKLTGLHVGPLINFNVRLLKEGIKRIVL